MLIKNISTKEIMSGDIPANEIFDWVEITEQDTDYIGQEKEKQIESIKSNYKNIMNDYVCAYVKRTLWNDSQYQSMVTDMINEMSEV